MFKKFKKRHKYVLICTSLLLFAIIIKVQAISPDVTFIENPYTSVTVIDNGDRAGTREVQLAITNTSAGKRLSTIDYCLDNTDCEDENNWHDVTTYDNNNVVSSLANAVGSVDITLFINIPSDKLKLRANFVDYEAINISYAKYNPSTTDESEYRDIYVDQIGNRDNYDNEFTTIATGYRGGDIVLPSGCTNNGCLLKFTMDEADYQAIINRLNYYNENYNEDDTDKTFLDLGSMNNHLSDYNLATDTVIYVEKDGELYIETENSTKSFYLIVNKFFSEKNRSDIAIADNKNRILSEDYIGLKYVVDRKYFDEGNNFGFLTFNEFNDYSQSAEIFYGTPTIKFSVDTIVEPALAAGGSKAGMGTIKHPYNKILSGDNAKFPINNSFELTINSFYEPDYIVPIILKNDDELVQNVSLTLSRFAFGGNAGGLLLVDDKGINCRRQNQNPDCREDNIYISTSYRGLIDTFYTDGTTTTIDTFEISNQFDGITGDFKNNLEVYNRNEDFNPWAVAIFYHNDEVIATKSFDLGELVKIEGYSEDVIANDTVNNIAKTFNNDLITDYDSNDFNIYGYGLGYEKSINDIKYFDSRSYQNGNIDYTLILASKSEIIDNNINRIALFLTNGELKSDEDNFPELTYGVGEGKIFEVDGRVFEELGGNQ